MSARLTLVPCGLAEANAFVGIEHRHNGKVPGCKFALSATLSGKVVGVVIVARTIARKLHDPLRAEVTRCATDGTRNACSFLYQKAKRVVQAMGYTSLKTYTRTDESGASLRAIGACCEAELKARSWDQVIKESHLRQELPAIPRARLGLIRARALA